MLTHNGGMPQKSASNQHRYCGIYKAINNLIGRKWWQHTQRHDVKILKNLLCEKNPKKQLILLELCCEGVPCFVINSSRILSVYVLLPPGGKVTHRAHNENKVISDTVCDVKGLKSGRIFVFTRNEVQYNGNKVNVFEQKCTSRV